MSIAVKEQLLKKFSVGVVKLLGVTALLTPLYLSPAVSLTPGQKLHLLKLPWRTQSIGKSGSGTWLRPIFLKPEWNVVIR